MKIDTLFWRLCKIAMLIQVICIITLVVVFIKISQLKAGSPDKPDAPFIDIHAHDKYQIVLYPNSKKQQMYFCYDYKIIDGKPTELILRNMQGNDIDRFVLSNSDIVICSTDVNFDDLNEDDK